MFSQSDLKYLQDALTDEKAGIEFANAVINGLVLSPDTFRRLGIAMGSDDIAEDIQDAILGEKSLTVDDKEYLTDGFSSANIGAQIVAYIIKSLGISNLVNPPLYYNITSSY